MKGENRVLAVLSHTIDHHFFSLLSILFLWTVLLAQYTYIDVTIALHWPITSLTVSWGSIAVKVAGSFLLFSICIHFYFVPHLLKMEQHPLLVLCSGQAEWSLSKKGGGGGHFFPSWGAQQHFEAWASVGQWIVLGILKLSRVHSHFTVRGIMDDCTLCS